MKQQDCVVYKVARIGMRHTSKEQLLRIHSRLCSLSHYEYVAVSLVNFSLIEKNLKTIGTSVAQFISIFNCVNGIL